MIATQEIVVRLSSAVNYMYKTVAEFMTSRDNDELKHLKQIHHAECRHLSISGTHSLLDVQTPTLPPHVAFSLPQQAGRMLRGSSLAQPWPVSSHLQPIPG